MYEYRNKLSSVNNNDSQLIWYLSSNLVKQIT